MGDTFLLHKEHSKFVPGKSKLSGMLRLHSFRDYNQRGGWIWNVFVTLPCVFLLFLMCLDVIQTELKYRTQGVTTTATLIDCQAQPSNRSIRVDLTFRYTVITEAGSQDYTATEAVYKDSSFRCEQVPSQFIIQHLSDPSTVHIEDERLTTFRKNMFGGLLLLLFGGIFVLVTLGYIGTTGIGEIVFVKRQIPLLQREGKLLDGKIVKVTSRQVNDIIGIHLVTVHYQFTVQKRILMGTFTQQMYEADGYFDPPPIGTPITILYAN
jgi:hypothetical protein